MACLVLACGCGDRDLADQHPLDTASPPEATVTPTGTEEAPERTSEEGRFIPSRPIRVDNLPGPDASGEDPQPAPGVEPEEDPEKQPQ